MRFAVDRKAQLIGETVSVDVQLKHISLTGVGVESPKKASLGARLQVAFEIPAFGYPQNLSIYALVSHIHNIDSGFYITLDYEFLSPKEKKIIQEFIEYKIRLYKLGKHHYQHLEN